MKYCICILVHAGSMAISKIAVIAYYIPNLYKAFPDTSTYYMCAIGVALSAIGLMWDIPLLYFVRTRKLVGMQHFMFAMMLHLLGSCLLAVITGAVYTNTGMFLSLSFVADIVRTPPQMFLVHKFIKTEHLNEDSHHVAAYYKKF